MDPGQIAPTPFLSFYLQIFCDLPREFLSLFDSTVGWIGTMLTLALLLNRRVGRKLSTKWEGISPIYATASLLILCVAAGLLANYRNFSRLEERMNLLAQTDTENRRLRDALNRVAAAYGPVLSAEIVPLEDGRAYKVLADEEGTTLTFRVHTRNSGSTVARNVRIAPRDIRIGYLDGSSIAAAPAVPGEKQQFDLGPGDPYDVFVSWTLLNQDKAPPIEIDEEVYLAIVFRYGSDLIEGAEYESSFTYKATPMHAQLIARELAKRIDSQE